MKPRLPFPLVATLSILGFSALLIGAASHVPPFGATPEPPASPPKPLAPQVPVAWKAGFASANVTPEKNLWMAGYAARKQPSEGKVQDLFAKALALEDETGGRFVFVTLDLIGVPQRVRWQVAERAEKEFQLPPSRLMLNASHTHSGPELYRRSTPPTEEDLKNEKIRDYWDYTRKLEDQMVNIIGEAIQHLEPARLTWGHAKCGFAMNRRRDYSLPEGHPNANKAPNPDGPVDHDVPALRVEAPDGTLKGVLFGYACHNTSLGFYYYCGDYAGYAQEYLQQNRPGFQAMFLMGCAGDQNPYPRRSGIVPGVTDLELAQQHGRSLANSVEMALTVNPRGVTGPIQAAYEEIDLVYADPKKPLHPYPVQVVKLGKDVTFVALGSEVTVDYSLRFKKELAGEAAVWVAGYSNDYTGYVPSLRVLKEGGYEAAAGWADDVEDRIAIKVHELHGKLKNP
ncbi:MAG: neutral/alkaline non-lysosomal ceramidase N-terminal domain-containing protein [Verrucomicrobiae bacterium]|nr:neutral/alkaline non-lysosomal ceramidase N-terminal domain-containing protein [Verrucomicrobiae bacterium]